MTARTFVYETLSGNAALTELIGGDNPRIFAKKTMTSSIEKHPFLVYKFGNATSEGLSETINAERQFFQVWVHDYHDGETADYMRIDAVVDAVKNALRAKGSGADGVWMINFLETSQDLNDETLNTIFRYIRFQLIKQEKES